MCVNGTEAGGELKMRGRRRRRRVSGVMCDRKIPRLGYKTLRLRGSEGKMKKKKARLRCLRPRSEERERINWRNNAGNKAAKQEVKSVFVELSNIKKNNYHGLEHKT